MLPSSLPLPASFFKVLPLPQKFNRFRIPASNLSVVSESLTLTFNLLTGYFLRQQPSSLRLDDVIFWEWSVSELSGFCVFLINESMDLREIFF